MTIERYRRVLTYGVKVSGIHYDQIADGSRSFVLLADDLQHGYQVGDFLVMQKWTKGEKVGEPIKRTVKSIQKSGKGLMGGYIILGLTEQE
jgi:hypothetical protein